MDPSSAHDFRQYSSEEPKFSDLSLAAAQAAALDLAATSSDHYYEGRFNPAALKDQTYIGVFAFENKKLVAALGGKVHRSRLQLELMVRQTSANSEVLDQLGHTLWQNLATSFPKSFNGRTIELWARPETEFHNRFAASLHLEKVRELKQLCVELPIAQTRSIQVLETRSFDPETDVEQLLKINNRAFFDHPDQSNLKLGDVENLFAEPGFAPQAIRILDDPATNRMAGFCWTKTHKDSKGDLGEIFVIAVDPDFQGRKLGAALTAAGLNWLQSQGLKKCILYVEADNSPALKVYERLGFTHLSSDTVWDASLASQTR